MMVRSQDHTIDKVADLIDKVIKWQNQQTEHVEKYTRTNWQFASYYIGVMKAFKATGNKDYQNFLYQVGEKPRLGNPTDMYHADKIAIGQIYLDLYQQKAEEVMIKNIKWILDANLLRNKPMPDVRYKKNPYRHEWWSWCDALFMAPPTLPRCIRSPEMSSIWIML